MYSADRAQAAVRLGTAGSVVSYPEALADWFAGLPPVVTPPPARRFALLAGTLPGRFKVAAGGQVSAQDFSLGDALATLWEQIAFRLVADTDDAFAVHAAALAHPAGQVLLPGPSGAGKTHLALWYRAHGCVLGTDEVVSIGTAQDAPDTLVTSVLARPVILKASARPTGLLHATPVQALCATGRLVRMDSDGEWLLRRHARTLIVFPRFVAGARIRLAALSAAQTALRLIENCVNWRNLPFDGLSLAGAIARRSLAVDLVYGDTAQLDGLEAFTAQVLTQWPPRDALAGLCAGHRPDTAPPPANADTTVAAPAVARRSVRLTVGMATYDDYDGAYFTIQSMRTYHPGLADDLEFVVIDNNPEGPCAAPLRELLGSVEAGRYVPHGAWSGTAIRDRIFEEARGEFVLCVDSHVLIASEGLSRLLACFAGSAGSGDLIQGPLVYDDLRRISTHQEPVWRCGMYGVWANDARGEDPQAPAFEIPMQGLGVFACRRTAWPWFNPAFRGFGGEEGYIHEKLRRKGGRTLCLPALRWLHRFGRPLGTRYRNSWEDRMRNYLIGFTELGLDTDAMESHFAGLLGPAVAGRIFAQVRAELEADRGP